jgi:hypothetical protein
MHVLRYYPPLGCEGLRKVDKNRGLRAEDWTEPSKIRGRIADGSVSV